MRAPGKYCPDRWAECHANCEKWAEYEKKRDAFYKKRAKLAEAEHDMRAIEVERAYRKQKVYKGTTTNCSMDK